MDKTIISASGGAATRFSQLIKSLGPGIMMATAAVGGSHLVASTKAGAIYGWQLAIVILLVNLFKYPFFRASVQYTMGTGKSLVEGYKELGQGYLLLFFALSAISAVVNTAALLLFSASLLGYFSPMDLPLTANAAIIATICLFILLAGHYKLLDNLSKLIMSVLVLATITTVVIAFSNGAIAASDYQTPSIWNISAIGFVVILMGWMPAPIEISSITSLWLKRQKQEVQISPKSALFDFNVGYIGTAMLAVVFLALGALVLHGNGQSLQTSGIGFSHQLVSAYAVTVGEWSRYLIAVVAFLCIFGSTITVIDGYARALAEAQSLVKKSQPSERQYHNSWMLIVSALAMSVLLFFTSALMTMLNFAMILAFMTTPIFALLNYKLVANTKLDGVLALSGKMRILCLIGLFYLFSFLAVFIWWKWFL